MLWTSWSMLIITVENQKSANYNNVHSCDFCFVLNTTLQVFISPKYWNYLFGYITFALFSYLFSFWEWYFHSFQVPWWSCWIFWKDLTKQLNSCFLRWPSSLLGSFISSFSLLDFYYILTMVLDINFLFLYQIFTILKYAKHKRWTTVTTNNLINFLRVPENYDIWMLLNYQVS